MSARATNTLAALHAMPTDAKVIELAQAQAQAAHNLAKLDGDIVRRMKILFVCAGNICRSPTAEGVMARMLAEAGLADRVTIDSAGTGAWHVGELPDPRTRAAARKRGLQLTHRARQLRRTDLDHFDLVVVMDGANLRHVTLMAEQRARARICLLRSFDSTAPEGAFVPDPYDGGARGFEEVLDICERACEGLLAHVRAAL